MAIDLKTLLPDTTFGSGAFLFGADSQSSSTPSIYGVDDVFGYLLGLSNTWTGQQTFAAGTITASTPLSITQTWNDGGTTFTGLKMTVTESDAASGSLLLDLQHGVSGSETSKFSVSRTGTLTLSTSGTAPVTSLLLNNFILKTGPNSNYGILGTTASDILIISGGSSSGNVYLNSQNTISSQFGWAPLSSFIPDLILTRKTGANLQLGAADAAAAIAQTLSVQSIASGTSPDDDNKVGANFTIRGSAGTGLGAGGSIIFQVAPSGTSGPNQNSFVDALTIASNRNVTFTGNVQGQGFITNTTTGLRLRSDNTVLAFGSSDDVTLYRDDTDTLALRRSTNLQTFNIYSTYTSPSIYARLRIGFTNTTTLEISGEALGGASVINARLKANTWLIYTNGNYRWSFGSDGHLTAYTDNEYDIGTLSGNRPRNLYVASKIVAGLYGVEIPTTTSLYWKSGTIIYGGGTDGNIRITNSSVDNFGLLQFGGTTSSFPALKRDATTLKVRLADDSGDAPITASTAEFSANVAVNGANTSQYNLSVDGSFGVFDGSNTVFTVNDPTTTKVLEVVDENDNELFSVNNSTTGTLLEVINGANDTVFSVNSNTDGALLEVTSVYDDTVFTVNSQTTGPILEVSSAYGDNLLSVSDKGSVTVNGVTATANDNVLLDLSQTWNAGANTVSGINLNVTDTSSNTASTLMDLKVGGSSNFSVEKIGNINFRGHRLYSDATAIVLTNSSATPSLVSRTDFTIIPTASSLRWGNLTSFNTDLILSRKGPANLQFGAADVTGDNAAASLKAQTLSVQSVATGGTLENVVGKDFTIQGSAGTGSGAGGSIIFQVAPAGGSGTGQNTLVDALTIGSDKNIEISTGSEIFAGTFCRHVFGANFHTFHSGGRSMTYSSGGELSLTGGGLQSIFVHQIKLGSASATSSSFYGDASNTISLRNGTNAQTFNIYRTFTDSSNYERGTIGWNVNDQFEIKPEKLGTGLNRELVLTGAQGSYVRFKTDNQIDFSGGGGVNISLKNLQTDLLKTVRIADQETVASLPTTPTVGMITRVTDGDSGLTFGQVVVNSGSGATPYLVWYNGTNWTVIGA